MKLEDIKIDMPVVYIPEHWLVGDHDKMIEEKNLGIVKSKNDKYAFVQYKGNTGTQATNPKDLYSLHNRPDLIEQLNQKI